MNTRTLPTIKTIFPDLLIFRMSCYSLNYTLLLLRTKITNNFLNWSLHNEVARRERLTPQDLHIHVDQLREIRDQFTSINPEKRKGLDGAFGYATK